MGLLRVLPEGWEMLGRCRRGAAGPASFPTGCYALAHPSTGIALIDIAPDITPNAEARLRRALGAANFWPAFPGYLPVWHGRIELSAWRSLPAIMAEGFSDLAPLTVPGRAAWIAAARAALAADPGWEAPGARTAAPQPEPDVLLPEEEASEPLPARRRWPLALGFVGTFLLGLGMGALLLLPSPPAPDRPRSLAEPAGAPAPAAPQEAARAMPPEDASPPVPVPIVAGQPAPPLSTESWMREPVPSAAEAAEALQGRAEDPGAEEAALPLPPAAPPPAAPRPARPVERVDAACAQALFRFQQGLPLTRAEEQFVRNGCALRR